MTHFFSWTLPLMLFCTSVLSQNLTKNTISGIVTSDATNEKLAYVNIGIRNKSFGTVSDFEGNFKLTVPDSLLYDTLTFSYIGFERKRVPVMEMVDSTKHIIRLKRKVAILKELKVYAKEPKIKKYGTRGHAPFVSVTAYIDRDIYEIAFLVKPNRTPVQVNKLHMFIKYSSIDSCLFRINLYDKLEGKPNQRINTENIIISHALTQSKWNSIDLSAYNLVCDDEFYVSVEFLPDFKEEKPWPIHYGAKLIKEGKTYFRESSMGEWTSSFGNVSFYVDVIY